MNIICENYLVQINHFNSKIIFITRRLFMTPFTLSWTQYLPRFIVNNTVSKTRNVYYFTLINIITANSTVIEVESEEAPNTILGKSNIKNERISAFFVFIGAICVNGNSCSTHSSKPFF